ncbi:hypothetical protein RFI_00668 [Reticulomyxa filosa]|uniref:Uncharacterized protein n=1 Tax=Reticulomyxa filosa TaxID=46433 RepID=X6PEE7_RETFI|nr:hypothetical protein RFI_00668 [Reticulomyxa filosa]|eukprot:ETO36394.1 hypothetical protein RFI_00668 [Reticulomyxa filosa]
MNCEKYISAICRQSFLYLIMKKISNLLKIGLTLQKKQKTLLNNSKLKYKCKNPEKNFIDEIDYIIFVTFLEKDKLYYQQYLNKYFTRDKDVINITKKQKNNIDEKDNKAESAIITQVPTKKLFQTINNNNQFNFF